LKGGIVIVTVLASQAACGRLLDLDRYSDDAVSVSAGGAGGGSGGVGGGPVGGSDVAPSVQWAWAIGDASDQLAGGVAVDTMSGAITIGGLTHGPFALPCAADPCPAVAPTSAPDPFLAGLDVDGSGTWGRAFDASAATATVDDVAASGALSWAAGRFDGSVGFGGPMVTAGSADLYVAAFSGTDGAPITQVSFYGDTLPAAYQGPNVPGRLQIGARNDALSLGGTSDASLADVFVRLDSASWAWSITLASASPDELTSVAFAADTVVVGGRMGGAWDCPDGTGSHGPGAFVAKLLPAGGGCAWVVVFPDDGVRVTAVAADNWAQGDRDVLVAGTFSTSIDFGAGPILASDAEEAFVAKLDVDGAVVWHRAPTSAGSQRPQALAVTPEGHAIVVGDFTSELGFDDTAVDDGTVDGFVLELGDADGTTRWSKQLGGPHDDQTLLDVAVDAAGRIMALGEQRSAGAIEGHILIGHGAADLVLLSISD
jgi:hypothetical protein